MTGLVTSFLLGAHGDLVLNRLEKYHAGQVDKTSFALVAWLLGLAIFRDVPPMSEHKNASKPKQKIVNQVNTWFSPKVNG